MSIREYYQRDDDFLLLPLHHHIGNKTVCLEIVQYLVEQWPESIKVRIHGNRVALHWACERCSPPAIIQYLAEQWPEAIRKKTNGKNLPLHLACAAKGTSLEAISYLLQMWPESIQMRNDCKYLPLDEACCENAHNANLIAFLINKWLQAVHSQCPGMHDLPLHLACRRAPVAQASSLPMLRLLIEAWPNAMSVQDGDGFLPLHYACRNVKVVASDTEEIQAPLETIKLLVEPRPESLQIKTDLGMLPLHWACFDPIAPTDVICCLVELSPKTVSEKDYKGRLPLHLACAQMTGSPPIEAIQCLVRAWLESIHILQGDDMSNYDSDSDSEEEDSVDDSACGDHEFDGLEALALDLVCKAATSKEQRAQPSSELLLLLTNEIPPLHFACATWFPDRSTTIQYLSTVVPNDCMLIHEGKLPFHHLCLAGAPRCFLEWWLEQCPDAISTPTTDTGDFPLHCYLSSRRMLHTTSSGNITTRREFFY